MLAKQCVEEDPMLRPDMKQAVISLSHILLSSIEWEATLAGNSQVFSGLVQGRWKAKGFMDHQFVSLEIIYIHTSSWTLSTLLKNVKCYDWDPERRSCRFRFVVPIIDDCIVTFVCGLFWNSVVRVFGLEILCKCKSAIVVEVCGFSTVFVSKDQFWLQLNHG